MEEGEAKGKLEADLASLRRLMEKRFGTSPQSVEDRLTGRSAAEPEDLIVRVLDAKSLDDLLH